MVMIIGSALEGKEAEGKNCIPSMILHRIEEVGEAERKIN